MIGEALQRQRADDDRLCVPLAAGLRADGHVLMQVVLHLDFVLCRHHQISAIIHELKTNHPCNPLFQESSV